MPVAASAASRAGSPAGQAPLPGQRVERAAERQRRRGEHGRAAAEQPLAQQPADRQRRHPQRPAAGRRRGRARRATRRRAARRVGSSKASRSRTARVVRPRPARDARRLRPAAPLGILAGVSAPSAVMQRTAASRTAASDAGRAPSGSDVPAAAAAVSSSISARPSPASSSRSATSSSTSLPQRRAADLDRAGGQLGGGDGGDPVDQLVRLVDDDDVVLGQHAELLQRVDGQQRVVGDDDVGLAGLGARPLGEAVRRRTGSAARRGTRAR